MMGLIGKIGGALFIVGIILYVNLTFTSSTVPTANTQNSLEMAQHMRILADKLQTQVSLTYASFSLGPEGDIYLGDAQIRSVAGPDLITADRVVIRHADISYLRSLWESMLEYPVGKRWPDRLSIRLEGARIELSDKNVKQLDRLLLNKTGDMDQAVIAMFTCREDDRFSFHLLKAMGISALTGTFDLDYSLNKVNKELQAQIQLTLDQLLTADAYISFATEPTPEVDEATQPVAASQSEARHSNPVRRTKTKSLRHLDSDIFAEHSLELKAFRLSYADQGFHTGRNKFCALVQEESEKQYLRVTGELFSDYLTQQGWNLTEESKHNFSAFLQPQGHFEFDVAALKPYVVSGEKALSLSPSAELLQSFYPLLVLNNKNEDLRSMWADITVAAPDGPMSVDEVEARKAIVRAAILKAVGRAPDVYERTFKVIAAVDADSYIGKRVKLETYFGRKVEGRLMQIEGDVLYVKEHLHQGSAIYPVAREKITQIEAFY